ncbi:MAG: hypothetical protein LQ344_001139 [Seirophora lacunosa]|nr:MAG: hypothetical protein LQ344_001139 [Seirophora lacunosa]
MALTMTALTTKEASRSPYQLDQPQTLKASTALLKRIKSETDRKEAASATKSLIRTEDSSDEKDSSDAEPIWLVLTTKRNIADQRRLKPGKIPLPHPLNTSPTTTTCLITCDPQRQVKDVLAHPSFPTSLASRITKVIGISKLKARYQPFESKRQLLDEHDVFLADARIITMLPKILGKTFYKGSKKPVPVSLEPYRQSNAAGKRVVLKPTTEKSKTIAPPLQVAKEIEKTLGCALVHLSPSNNVSVRVGLSSFTPQQIADNVEAVVNGLAAKFIPKGWRNVRGVHVKGPNTMALPIWLADELWVEEGDVLDDAEAEEVKAVGMKGGAKRKARLLNKAPGGEEAEAEGKGVKRERSTDVTKEDRKKRKRVDEDPGLSKEIRERREKLREQKKADRENMRGTTEAVAVE